MACTEADLIAKSQGRSVWDDLYITEISQSLFVEDKRNENSSVVVLMIVRYQNRSVLLYGLCFHYCSDVFMPSCDFKRL